MIIDYLFLFVFTMRIENIFVKSIDYESVIHKVYSPKPKNLNVLWNIHLLPFSRFTDLFIFIYTYLFATYSFLILKKSRLLYICIQYAQIWGRAVNVRTLYTNI